MDIDTSMEIANRKRALPVPTPAHLNT